MSKGKFEPLRRLDDILRIIPADMLEFLSYESKLGKSLKKTLRHFDGEKLLEEAEAVAEWLSGMNDILRGTGAEYRIKSLESIRDKYERSRNIQGSQACRVFNDILGLRFLCDSYKGFLCAGKEPFRVVDMSEGKANDDGYKGVHIYYQLNSIHYPIEIQLHTIKDSQINAFLHDNVYKKGLSSNIGRRIRENEEGSLENGDGLKRIPSDIVLPENTLHIPNGKIIEP